MTFNPISTECELSVMYRILLGHWETFRIMAVSIFWKSTQFPKAVIYSICCNLSKCVPGHNIAVDKRSLRQSTGSFQSPAGSVTRRRLLRCGWQSATAFSWQTDVCDTVGASHFPDFSEHAQSLDSFIHLAWQPSMSTDTKGVEALLKPP